ncbi:isoprenylcysteine carboxyl methyltransferase family protein [Deinococcus fonticola]|uniref:isoprenylcysteine carboxyl methyltransferase family protein n=1 Tax=Deinococcus fonticola TaxID=2528713 RepID=UPI0010754A89|nr:isoprenylcysteine carboxylmethyltransferase family protein [Deinococcus fonticola]
MKARAFTPLLVGALVTQRLLELRHARQNERLARQAGATEHGRGHYPAIVLLHAAWLAGLLLEGRQSSQPINKPALATALALQVLRYKVMNDLGVYWNTRILIWPGAKRVEKGTYKFIRHPNYWVVMAELYVVPQIVQAHKTSLIGGTLNLLLLHFIRIPAEEKALRNYDQQA